MDVIVLVCKIPAAGFSKTRLVPHLGTDLASKLAEVMLQDVLCTAGLVAGPNVRRVWFYMAPGGDKTEEVAGSEAAQARRIVDSVPQAAVWETCSSRELFDGECHVGLGLGLILSRLHAKYAAGAQSITFIGGDTPQLPAEEISRGIGAAQAGEAYLCPSTDGGYVLLALPCAATPDPDSSPDPDLNRDPAPAPLNTCAWQRAAAVFAAVEWSVPRTCADQLRALWRLQLTVRVGCTYTDMDDAEDLEHFLALCRESRCGSLPHGYAAPLAEATASPPIDSHDLRSYKAYAIYTNIFLSRL